MLCSLKIIGIHVSATARKLRTTVCSRGLAATKKRLVKLSDNGRREGERERERERELCAGISVLEQLH